MCYFTHKIFLLIFAIIWHVDALQRIVGGQETTIEKRPYQASLQYIFGDYVYHTCGASIISSKFLLTAAHCDPHDNVAILFARVGSTAYNSGGQLLRVYKFTPHPKNDYNLDYDFAIVSLKPGTEIKFGPTVATIKLADGKDPADGSLVTVSGWGVTEEQNGNAPVNLKEVDLPVFNFESCSKIYSNLSPRFMCLGGTPEGHLSACFGDSGGPAVQDGVQYALVTGGYTCERPNIPGLYSRISEAREWIKEVTGV